MVDNKAGAVMIAPYPNIASQIFEMASQVESLAFGTAEVKRAKDEEDAVSTNLIDLIDLYPL